VLVLAIFLLPRDYYCVRVWSPGWAID
jgi:hypothetical protein